MVIKRLCPGPTPVLRMKQKATETARSNVFTADRSEEAR